MNDIPEGTVLRCPSTTKPPCIRQFQVSPEDPDATLSEVVNHLTSAPHYHNHQTAMRLLAQVEEVKP
ncbi:hypothetical protein BDK92_7074 [Micromonospora pisi]|uniref:Uncharacterized protein n=1 Tax=Micromonospora pisi TaxID=589240 RepID=A0A495JWA3_9ACTN|nr:hypothetical protein [Micromonospora pisi]RKR92632.1 hypothetical protein BDK92_7074 [Micromonospora pisi]